MEAKNKSKTKTDVLLESQRNFSAQAKVFLAALFGLVSLILIVVLIGLFVAPIFTILSVLCCSLAVAFVFTEGKSYSWHHAHESENRFWTMLGLLFCVTVFFAPDSPFGFGRSHPWIAALLSLVLVYLVHHFDRKKSRLELLRPRHLKRINSVILTNAPNAKDKLKTIEDCLQKLDFPVVAFKQLRQANIVREEQTIIDTLQMAQADELNYILTNTKLALLFYKVKDADAMMPLKSLQNRTAILKLLVADRLDDLNVHGRVAVIDALQHMRLSAHASSEIWVRDLLLATRGESLLQLKCLTDTKGGANNLHKLIFKDVRSPEIRDEILRHFAQQAQDLQLMTGRPTALRKVLSDVDDTLYSSGGRFPAGIDTSFPRHELYPGVLSFYKELDMGWNALGVLDDDQPGNLVFLSARPHVYKDKAEVKSYELFESLRHKHGPKMHAVPTLLAGSLDSGFKLIQGDYLPVAKKKFENFEQYAQLYPECSFVFVCDNGQGDVMTAEMMAEKFADRLEAVFVHQVQPLHMTPGYQPDSPQRWNDMKIIFFQTYVDAAIRACELQLLHPQGLRRICLAAVVEFDELNLAPDVREDRRLELNRDLHRANQLLASHLVQSVPRCQSACIFPKGTHVRTSFGPGCVVRFRPTSGIYEVELTHWRLSGDQPVKVFVHGSSLAWQSSGQPGDPVWTPFGTGILKAVRLQDGMHEVDLRGNPPTSPWWDHIDSDTDSASTSTSDATRAVVVAAHSLDAQCPVPDLHPPAFSLDPTGYPPLPPERAMSLSLSLEAKFEPTGEAVMLPPPAAPAPLSSSSSSSSSTLPLFKRAATASPSLSAASSPVMRPSTASAGAGAVSAANPSIMLSAAALARLRPVTVATAFIQADSVHVIAAAVGDSVMTPYGVGLLERYRRSDDMYQVLLVWGARAFVKSDTISRLLTPDPSSKGRCSVM